MRDGYKLTEVGFIPEDWEHKTIGEISEFVGSGITPRGGQSVYKIEGVPFIRSQNVYPSGLRLDDVAYIDESQHQNMIRTEVKPGDVLLNITGASIGRCTAVPSNFVRGNVNQHVCIIRSNSSIFPIFLGQYLSSKSGQDQIDSFNTGSSREGLNFQQVRSIKLPFPPLPEQQKIADILTTVDAHVSETEALIEKTKALKQGLMQQLLTKGIGHTEFKDTEIGRIPLEWEVYTVKSICKICTGKRNTQDKIDDAEYPFFVRSKNIERIDEFDFDEEAVLTAGDGVGTGKVFHYIVGKFAVHQRVYKMSHFTSVDGKYFFYYFSENFIFRVKKMSAKNSVDSVRLEMIADMLLPLPELPEQRQIAAILTSIDDQIDTYQAKLASLTRLKTGLMQQLLTGKIRVKV